MELKEKYFLEVKQKKQIALRNSGYMFMLASELNDNNEKLKAYTVNNKACRIRDCLNFWLWDRYEKNRVLDLLKVSRCKDKFCPNCRRWNVSNAIIRFAPMFKKLLSEDYNPYMATFTVPNISGEDLSGELKKMTKAFSKIWFWLNREKEKHGYKDRLFDVVGAVKVLEVTRNKETNMYHPHFHIIMFLENDFQGDFVKDEPAGFQRRTSSYIYNSRADKMLQRLWKMAYKEENIVNYDVNENDRFVCDIRELEMPGGIYEVFKYSFKDVDIVDIDVFKVFYYSLFNKRLKQGYGKLYGIDDYDNDDVDNENNIGTYLKIEEDPEKLATYKILDMVCKYKEYKKISRFKRDIEVSNIKE